jgi:threonine/homoserine/homoserine lactone efflux protein
MTTDITLALLGVLGALAIGVVSPGPSFIMVARTAVAQSRADGVAAALGMGVGGMLFGAAAIAGLAVVLTAVPWLYLALKLAGGAYLVYLGWRIFRSAAEPLAVDSADGGEPSPTARGRSFALGLLTQVSNPKTAIIYASVFAALLPPQLPLAAMLLLPLAVFVIEAGWYAIVALLLSARAPRAAYLRYKRWIDRAAGGVMAVLGLRLLSSARAGTP